MKRYIPLSRVEGTASRQAHCDLPEGTYEREMSKEGFFGPAAFFYHRHPPNAQIARCDQINQRRAFGIWLLRWRRWHPSKKNTRHNLNGGRALATPIFTSTRSCWIG